MHRMTKKGLKQFFLSYRYKLLIQGTVAEFLFYQTTLKIKPVIRKQKFYNDESN